MNQQSIVYSFLVNPKFRTLRYLTILTFFTIVNLNQALVGYESVMPMMGNKVYGVVAGTVLVFIISVYLFFKTILKDLSVGKYTQFVLCTIACALFFTAIPNVVYACYLENYDFFSAGTVIDNLSAFTIYLLCISGIFIPVFIKNWVTSNQHLNQLKIKQKVSKVEQLKEQINPSAFFEVLNKSGALVKSEPEKASTMLMKLSQLLRYQLYDCNRAQVLLSAEIAFLRNFLDLKKLHSPTFDYAMTITGSINGVFIVPTILLPYVQSLTNDVDDNKEATTLNIRVDYANPTIGVTLTLPGNGGMDATTDKLAKVRERLNTLYGDRYELTVSGEAPAATTVCLKLEEE